MGTVIKGQLFQRYSCPKCFVAIYTMHAQTLTTSCFKIFLYPFLLYSLYFIIRRARIWMSDDSIQSSHSSSELLIHILFYFIELFFSLQFLNWALGHLWMLIHFVLWWWIKQTLSLLQELLSMTVRTYLAATVVYLNYTSSCFFLRSCKEAAVCELSLGFTRPWTACHFEYRRLKWYMAYHGRELCGVSWTCQTYGKHHSALLRKAHAWIFLEIYYPRYDK